MAMIRRVETTTTFVCFTAAFLIVATFAAAVGDNALQFDLQLYLQPQPKCEPIVVSLCQDTPYNYTRMPNLLGHHDQDAVESAVKEYKPLIDIQCSEHLKFFLCSIFTPMCTANVDASITSCRSVCEDVKRSCLPLLENFGFKWPDMLNCSQFPVKSPGVLCMDPLPEMAGGSIGGGGGGGGGGSGGLTSNGGGDSGRNGDHLEDLTPRKVIHRLHPSIGDNGNANIGGGSGGLDKKPGADDQSHSVVVNLNGDGDGQFWVLLCNTDWMFKRDHKQFAEAWMASWSVICIVVTAFTVVTFCLDTSRFRYPERSIIFLSLCYNFCAWAYVLRWAFGADESSCQTGKQQRYLIAGKSENNPKCVIIFMILYYFSTASSIWWVVLTFTWFLAAGRKWGQEAIASVSSYFHLAAWGIPALMTIAVLVTQQVDAGELTGMCFVGQQDSRALLGFVIAPTAVFVLTGVGFIVAGFVAMIRIRQEIRSRGRDTNDLSKLEKLMVKIGIFSVLYVLPALVVIGCNLYEKLVLDVWTVDNYQSHCKRVTSAMPQLTDLFAKKTALNDLVSLATPGGDECLNDWLVKHKRPMPDVYILKIFMVLVVGITSGMWVWSRKTCATWQARLPFCCGSSLCRLLMGPSPAKAPVQYQLAPLLTAEQQSSYYRPSGSTFDQARPNQHHQHPKASSTLQHAHHQQQQQQQQQMHSLQHQRPANAGSAFRMHKLPAAYLTTTSSEASARI